MAQLYSDHRMLSNKLDMRRLNFGSGVVSTERPVHLSASY